MNRVMFKAGTYSSYNSLAVKDTNTLYFITDRNEVYKGSINYTSSVIIVDSFPTEGIQGKLYINSDTLESKIYISGEWQQLNPGAVSSISDDTTDNDAKLATIKAIKDYVAASIESHNDKMASDTEAGHVTVDGSTIISEDGKISVGLIDQSKVSGLSAALEAKADTNSPTFTGVVTLPSDEPTVDNQAVNKKYVDDKDANTLSVAKAYADSILGANDAMLFKGTVGTDGIVTSLPAEHEVGWTYKVITAGTYAGKVCEIGDMIICVTDGTEDNDADWTVVQSNIDGVVTGPVSAEANRVVVFDGTSGKLIKDSGYTIEASVPSDAKFTDTTYELGTSSDSETVTVTMTGTDGVNSSIVLRGEGSTKIKRNEAGEIVVGCQNTDTTYQLDTEVSDNVATVTLVSSDENDTDTSMSFVAGDNVTISLEDDKIKFSVTTPVASDIKMTGYMIAGEYSSITSEDTVLTAIAKLEAKVAKSATEDYVSDTANAIVDEALSWSDI